MLGTSQRLRTPGSRPSRVAGLAFAFAVLLSAGACTDSGGAAGPDGEATHAPGEELPVPETLRIPAGSFVAGSDRNERELAYQLDEAAYGHDYTRRHGWYEDEPARREASTGAYEIARTLITNRQYAAFVEATGHRAPDVDPAAWKRQGLAHPYERTRRFAWSDGEPPEGRLDHPVVLVSLADARAYAAWLADETGRPWRLPTEAEWEKAARGTDGRIFPWGEGWDPTLLNTHDRGPFDTVAVGSFPEGASPFGLLDPAGQVFEWTATAWGAGYGQDGQDGDGRDEHEPSAGAAGAAGAAGSGKAESRPQGEAEAAPPQTVKGAGSWDDQGCGVCRPASRHSRPPELLHILVGFRVMHDAERRQDESRRRRRYTGGSVKPVPAAHAEPAAHEEQETVR